MKFAILLYKIVWGFGIDQEWLEGEHDTGTVSYKKKNMFSGVLSA